MKTKIIRISILAGVFMIAIILFSYITNRGNIDMTADMESATLPRITFTLDAYNTNPLVGYINEMDVTAMRDDIIPVAADGSVTLNVDAYDSAIKSLSYEVLSLNGENKIFEDTIKTVKESQTLQLGEATITGIENVLKITLHLNKNKEVYYYTRVLKNENAYTKECMDYVNDFHTKTFDITQEAAVQSNLESNSEGDNSTFQQVNIHSDIKHVMWGELKPQIIGAVQWNIKETTDSYTSFLLEYRVTCIGEVNKNETYNVKEFFRVRYNQGTMYLLDYNRTMNQIFDETKQVLTEKGILLGVTTSSPNYATNQDGTIVSFVQERELWNYNKKEDALSLIFSFASAENDDLRNLYNQHDIHIITVDDNGSTTFLVLGYMNRGQHEGEVGAAVYYYDSEKNSVEEKAFIPNDKAFAIAEQELGNLAYYNNKQEILYTMAGGTLYKVNLTDKKQESIVKGLKEGQYVLSEDGKLLAYQSNGELQTATKVTVLNFETGKNYEIEAASGECITPLGFVLTDFVYGVNRTTDVGKTVVGDNVTPMYKIEICNMKGKVQKTYAADLLFILDVQIENNMITINRATKNGAVYTSVAPDYITNNKEKKASNIELESIITDTKETQMRLTYADGISDKTPKILKPKQVIYKNQMDLSFENKNKNEKYYVYGYGEMLGVYDKAGNAIQKADSYSGVVISSKQAYVWERGNRDLTYEIENMGLLGTVLGPEMAAGKLPVDIIKEYSGGTVLDLTGCTIEQILYIINQGTPVIAMTDSSNAILLTGYGQANVQYMNPATGAIELQPKENIDAMVVGSGKTFIGFLK